MAPEEQPGRFVLTEDPLCWTMGLVCVLAGLSLAVFFGLWILVACVADRSMLSVLLFSIAALLVLLGSVLACHGCARPRRVAVFCAGLVPTEDDDDDPRTALPPAAAPSVSA